MFDIRIQINFPLILKSGYQQLPRAGLKPATPGQLQGHLVTRPTGSDIKCSIATICVLALFIIGGITVLSKCGIFGCEKDDWLAGSICLGGGLVGTYFPCSYLWEEYRGTSAQETI